jgi:hypothetical protein
MIGQENRDDGKSYKIKIAREDGRLAGFRSKSLVLSDFEGGECEQSLAV